MYQTIDIFRRCLFNNDQPSIVSYEENPCLNRKKGRNYLSDCDASRVQGGIFIKGITIFIGGKLHFNTSKLLLVAARFQRRLDLELKYFMHFRLSMLEIQVFDAQ